MIRAIVKTNLGKIPLEVRLAQNEKEIEKALKLRQEVLAEDKNLSLDGMTTFDEYDQYCDHLIVIRLDNHQVVGTNRLFSGRKANPDISFISDRKFDLNPFKPWMDDTVELGNCYILRDYNNSAVIIMLWEEIARYMVTNNYQYLIGQVIIKDRDNLDINEIYTYLRQFHNFGDFTIKPKDKFKIYSLKEKQLKKEAIKVMRQLPPLMKAFLRYGAYLGGEPAGDLIKRTKNFIMIVDKEQILKTYQYNYQEAN